MKALKLAIFILFLMSPSAFAGTKAVVTLDSCKTTPSSVIICSYTASVSNKIFLGGLEVEIDRTKSSGQVNDAIRADAVTQINDDTPGTMTSANDVFLSGGFVN